MLITAISSGNFSDTSIWDSGTVPTVGDTADIHGFAVIADGDITCDAIINTVASNSLSCTGNRTITAAIIATTSGALVTSTGGNTIVINGTCTSTGTNASCFLTTALDAWTVSGNVTASAGAIGGTIAVSSTCSIVGNVSASGANSIGISAQASVGAPAILGNVSATSGGVGVAAVNGATPAIHGNVSQDSHSNAFTSDGFSTVGITAGVSSSIAGSSGRGLGPFPQVRI